jgi:hypothetical protein
MDSKVFWRWCVSLGITRIKFLDFEHDFSETGPFSETLCSSDYRMMDEVQKHRNPEFSGAVNIMTTHHQTSAIQSVT